MRYLSILILAVFCAALSALAETPARPDSSAFLAVRDHVRGPGLAANTELLRQQVRDPLFAFVFTMTERDSLGAWTADDLAAFAAEWGEESVFPLAEHLAGLRREALPADEVHGRRGVRCRRRWVIDLEPAGFEMPMPYSILGYHPGKLSFRSPLVLNEWPVGARSIDITVEGATRRYHVTGLTVYQIDSGWIILDVDAWLDALLGSGADDAVMQGFTVGWVDGELVGVGSSSGRKGRRIYGELDFREGTVESHGRPVARGLSSEGRRWLPNRVNSPREIWDRYDD